MAAHRAFGRSEWSSSDTSQLRAPPCDHDWMTDNGFVLASVDIHCEGKLAPQRSKALESCQLVCADIAFTALTGVATINDLLPMSGPKLLKPTKSTQCHHEIHHPLSLSPLIPYSCVTHCRLHAFRTSSNGRFKWRSSSQLHQSGGCEQDDSLNSLLFTTNSIQTEKQRFLENYLLLLEFLSIRWRARHLRF
jgi:hypothetical protein